MTAIALSGAQGLSPGRGEVVLVDAGSVLVFAEESTGRRLPLTTLGPGDLAVGCSTTATNHRLLLTGLPGTQVRRSHVSDVLRNEGPRALERWISAVNDSARGERWVEHVVVPHEGSLRLAPGEHVAATAGPAATGNRRVLGWLRVVTGGARLCTWSQASVGPSDGPIPMTRGAWLTSNLHTRIAKAPAPADDDESAWTDALDLIGRLGLGAAAQRRHTADADRAERLVWADATAEEDFSAGVVALSSAFAAATASATAPPMDLAAAWWVSQEVGLTADDPALQRAELLHSRGTPPVQAVAEACGARMRTIRLPDQWWRAEGPPLVGHHHHHGHVALRWRRGRWRMTVPALRGEDLRPATDLVVGDAQAAEPLGSEATQLVALLPSAPTTLQRLVRLSVAKVWPDAVSAVALSALMALVAFATPYILGQIAGDLLDITIWHLVGLLSALILLELALASWRSARGVNLIRLRTRSVGAAAMAVWDRMIRQRARWHSDLPLGQRLVSLASPNLASNALPNTTVNQLLDSGMVIGGLAAVATTTLPLLVAIALVVAAQTWVGVVLVRRLSTQSQLRVAASAEAHGRLIETLRGVNTLRLFQAQPRAFRRWAQAQAVLAAADMKLRKLGTSQMVFTAAWPIIGLIVVVSVSAASQATFGEFVTAQTAASVMAMAVAATTMAAGATTTARAQLNEATALLAASPEQPGQGESPGVLNGAIAVADVVFRYQPDSPNVLQGVSLTVSPGEHVAIVGPSGCGKTTLIRVLLGLEEPTSGVIAFDGRDLATLERPALRRQIGTVLQSADLLAGSIRDNIDMGRNLSTAEVWASLDAAAIGDDIRAMPLGMDTTVIDGNSSLSGGQRQRILIARALAGRPRMVIFDEATSALDNVTQRAVVESLSELSLTRIVVAHRLSTVKRADRIIVLVRGRVEQEGTYEELMAQPGTFRDLATRQLT
jgi:ABC-type bacteriocin/lantibiotic exporter with double-glycine peptidase domain